MNTPTPEEAAIAAVVATADLLADGRWPEADTEAHRLLHHTDVTVVALLAGILVMRIGDPAREVLRDIGLSVSQGTS